MSFKVKRAGAVLELTGEAVAAPEGAPPASALQQMAQPAAAEQPRSNPGRPDRRCKSSVASRIEK